MCSSALEAEQHISDDMITVVTQLGSERDRHLFIIDMKHRAATASSSSLLPGDHQWTNTSDSRVEL